MGASVVAGGVNVAVFAPNASRLELCVYDDAGTHERLRADLPARTGGVWHGHLPGAGAGLVYGLRAHGPWAPHDGHRFNPARLLLDPWAREVVGAFRWDERQRGHAGGDPARPDPRDNGDIACKARVVGDDGYDWRGDAPPAVPWADTVVYELHVRGFTKRHPGVPAAERGTFAGLASDAAIAHFRRLGVTTLELLPVHQFIDEERLVRLGLANYWGYNTLGFFCPHPRYGRRGAGRALRDEFRDMVGRLHAAGLEVVLDVVFNHTAESDETGPTLAWRGLDNANWYRLDADDRAAYENPTGTGNALDLRHPHALQLVTDSLRWWVEQFHVDGFRFDLAPVLARGDRGFEPRAAFFAAIAQDPVLQGIKLIAEPWDIGPGGYQLGAFPTGWSEWNDRFRDTMRAFWLGHPVDRGEFARRLCASADLFQRRHRAPSASLNFVTAHDGFTLRDLVSYDERHNEANGEGNRDGHGRNLGWNCGVEGETDDPVVRDRRARLQRALLATLLLAQGTPMLGAGDELGHGQRGNNNPYCQDNELTWLDWAGADPALTDWVATLIRARRDWRLFPDAWTTGRADAAGRVDLDWLRPDGRAPTIADWQDGTERVLGARLGAPHDAGPPWLVLFNAGSAEREFVLPEGRWRLRLCSLPGAIVPGEDAAPLAARCPLPARCLRVLRRVDG
jgi:glycogen operon protein